MHANGKTRTAHRISYELFNGPIPPGKLDKYRQGKDHSSVLLTEQQVRDIRKICKEGQWGIQTSLAKQYGVSHTVINDVVTGRTWKCIED